MIRDRKVLLYVVVILLIAVFSLSVAYAALNTILRIDGSSEIVASNWDIYFDNISIVSGSVTSDIPKISDGKNISFTTTLNKPGDYFRFVVDIVNNGTIDAMIDNIVMISDLTDEQKKFVELNVMYTDGTALTNKQLLPRNSSKNITVEVMFRKDIDANSLPNVSNEINLEFSVIYFQADDSLAIGTDLVGNYDMSSLRVVNGDLYTVGSEVCVLDQCFYVISSDEETTTLLAKYNLFVGNQYDPMTDTLLPIADASGVQSPKAVGCSGNGEELWYGGVAYSTSVYWSGITTVPAYIYNDKSILFSYVEEYKSYLEGLGVEILDARLVDLDELIALGCSKDSKSCLEAPSWVYSTTYWTGSAYNNKASVYFVNISGTVNGVSYRTAYGAGVRPVIVIPTNM